MSERSAPGGGTGNLQSPIAGTINAGTQAPPYANANANNGDDPLDRRLPLYAYLEPLWTGRKVLEIGCGTGSAAEYLAAHGASRVVAIDADPSLIERARARHRRPGLEFRTLPHLSDLTKLAEAFDVVLAPDAALLARRGEVVAAWKRALAEGGRLIVSAANADRPAPEAGAARATAGVGYYELADALAPHFSRVQMFGQTPFVGFGMIEFDSAADELRVDARLVEEAHGGGGEPATHYVAIAGADEVELGYTLVQMPFASVEARLAKAALDDGVAPLDVPDGRRELAERRLDEVERRARARTEEADGRISELRRRLDDATVQSESAMRIARAQGEEIEELRARLRRAAEDRGALDGEVGKLRRALAEADESVLSITRRTAEEMTAVAERLATGLRQPDEAGAGRTRLAEYAALRDDADQLRARLAETEARAGAAERRLEDVATAARDRDEEFKDLRARLRRAEDALEREKQLVAGLNERLRGAAAALKKLEEREAELRARDERIARLEGEKQDLAWRTAELEEKLRTAIARAVKLETGPRAAAAPAPSVASAAPATSIAPAVPPRPAAPPPSAASAAPEEGAAIRSARNRAMEEFHRAATTHIDEVTRLQSSVAEQSALVAELEDSLKNAEARASAATAEAATLRRSAKELEDADRARRSRLAELEGKLLRLEHEKRAAAPATPVSDELERKLQSVETEREVIRTDRDRLRADRDRLGDQLAGAAAEIAALSAQLVTAREQHQATANGKDAAAGPVPAQTLEELAGIEKDLRQEMDALSQIEARLESEIHDASQAAGGEVGADVALLHSTLGNFRVHAARLRDEIEGCRMRMESLSAAELSGFLEELGENLAELSK